MAGALSKLRRPFTSPPQASPSQGAVAVNPHFQPGDAAGPSQTTSPPKTGNEAGPSQVQALSKHQNDVKSRKKSLFGFIKKKDKPRTQEQVQPHEEEPDPLQGGAGFVETGWNGFKAALGILKEASAAFPPLQGAVGGLLGVISIADKVADNRENFETMTRHITSLSEVLSRYRTPPTQDMVTGLVKSIERQQILIQERMQRNVVNRVLRASAEADEITKSLRHLSFAMKLFEINIAMDTNVQGQRILKLVEGISQRDFFRDLGAVSGARYNEAFRPLCMVCAGCKSNTGCTASPRYRTGCMPGTRVDTLTRVLVWATDPNPDSPPVFWLSGMAGIGKSAIAHSFCQAIDHDRLGASFFCSRQSQGLNNVNCILPTVAYQLAHRSQTYLQALVDVLKENTSYMSYALAAPQDQVKYLFIDLKNKLEMEFPLIVVLDALDECSGLSAVSDFLRVILHSKLPLKFLISTRPEAYIDTSFSSPERSNIDTVLAQRQIFHPQLLPHTPLQLHHVESDIVEEDIERYLTHALSPVLTRNRINAQTSIAELTRKCQKLFLVASIAVRHICPSESLNLTSDDIQRRVSVFLSPSIDSHSTKTLDDVYKQIFDSADAGKGKDEQEALRASLHMLLCLGIPQSINFIASLRGKDQEPDIVRKHLQNFASVLVIPDNNEEPVLTFHASFSEYVRRSEPDTLRSPGQHRTIASKCLELMNKSLKEDICGIKTRGTPNTSIDESIIRSNVTPELRYACVYWGSHLNAGAKPDPSILAALKLFLGKHLLHWLECLSLIHELNSAFDCIKRARLYLTKFVAKQADTQYKKQKELGAIRDLALEAEIMVPQVYHFLKIHPLEAYASVLVWLPTESALRKKYHNNRNPAVLPRVLLGLESQWNACLQMLRITGRVNCLALSPSGVSLACGTGNAIQIWDLATGELSRELMDHTQLLMSMAFSPDGSMLASGSDDKTVRIWDAHTWQLIRKLPLNDGVTSVVFSPNTPTLAIGSRSGTVQSWDIDTVEALTLNGHTSYTTSVAFSQDGTTLASGSQDKIVRVWNILGSGFPKKLEGHTQAVTSVAFSGSLDEPILASGSEDGVRIWNIGTGDVHALHIPARYITSVAFYPISPSGYRLISGSQDGTVCIWNAAGELVKTLSGHKESITSLAFSSDGSRLASGSQDNTVRIWNAVQDTVDLEPPSGHTNYVSSVAFSSDTSILVSGSYDKTVRLWRAGAGDLIKELSDRRDSVISVGFRSNERIKLRMEDGTGQIWDVNRGAVDEMQDDDGNSDDDDDDDEETQSFGQPAFCLDDDDDGRRIAVRAGSGSGNQPYLWIWGPNHQRDVSVSVFARRKACLGYSTGNIVILELPNVSVD